MKSLYSKRDECNIIIFYFIIITYEDIILNIVWIIQHILFNYTTTHGSWIIHINPDF